MFEYKSGFVWIENTEDYLNALEVEDWELVHFVPVPVTVVSVGVRHRRRAAEDQRAAQHGGDENSL